MKKNAAFKPRGGKGWLLVLAFMLIACMVMGLVLVWSNIERMDTTYFINIAQNELRERRALRAKLEVERERLLSPYELRRRAEEFGMREPQAGADQAHGNSLGVVLACFFRLWVEASCAFCSGRAPRYKLSARRLL